jgi:hypothetical protein
MRSFSIIFCITVFIIACKSKTGSEIKNESKTKLPAAATLKESVKQLIAGKDFIIVMAGLYDPVSTDTVNPYKWINESKDTSQFNKAFLEKEMTLEFIFNQDSTGIMFYDKQPGFDSSGNAIYVRKTANITYKVDDNILAGELPGVKLRVAVEQRNHFDGSMEKLVSDYFVAGADENGILLIAPRSYLNKMVVVLMKPKEIVISR